MSTVQGAVAGFKRSAGAVAGFACITMTLFWSPSTNSKLYFRSYLTACRSLLRHRTQRELSADLTGGTRPTSMMPTVGTLRAEPV